MPGIFSVSDSKRVRFAKGNLVAHTNGSSPSATNTTWSFHENQYDRLCEQNDVTGDCELFGYSTNSTYYGLNSSTASGNYSGDFVDWGNVFGADSPWHTLTWYEWSYLLNTRSQTMKYLMVKVLDNTAGSTQGLYGLMIFPDNFTWPAGVGAAPTNCNGNIGNSTIAWDNFSLQVQTWNSDAYYCSAETFAVLEQAGCVFFPATSYRSGASGTGDGGYYTSISIRVNSQDDFYFGVPGHVHIDLTNGVAHVYNSGHYGRPVRLVQEIAL